MNRKKLVFNKTIASELLGILPHQIKKVEEWANCVYVWGAKISRFISKQKFLQAFVDVRKERAKSLIVQEVSPTEFAVFNPDNHHNYLVEFSGTKIECGCEDYNNQVSAFGKGACKHIYASLFYRGYSSLKHYENSVK